MEDLDTPRVVPGAADGILRTLERFGFAWEGPVLFQSARQEAYQAALDRLIRDRHAYPCGCSRKEVADSVALPGAVRAGCYPGTCRAGLAPGRVPRAWRFRTHNTPVRFRDRVQGWQEQRVEECVGDFVLRRADNLFAYQLAVVVDDAAQHVTDVVRGADLLESTPRQILLQQALAVPTPTWLHLPVALNAAGQKLSKQTRAAPLDVERPGPALWQALRFLGQEPPEALRAAGLEELWTWAHAHWEVGRIPAEYGLPA